MKEGSRSVHIIVALVVVITIALVSAYVYEDPSMMVEDEVLFSIFALPILACIASSILFAIVALLLRVRWRYMAPTVLISLGATILGVLIITVIPGRNYYFYQLMNSHPIKSELGQVIIGSVPTQIKSEIRTHLPEGWRLFATYGSDSVNNRYWFVAVNQDRSGVAYRIGFYDTSLQQLSETVSIDNLWEDVIINQKLLKSSKYKQFSGIPTLYGVNSDTFAQYRIVRFNYNDRVYSVRLIPDDLSIHTEVTVA